MRGKEIRKGGRGKEDVERLRGEGYMYGRTRGKGDEERWGRREREAGGEEERRRGTVEEEKEGGEGKEVERSEEVWREEESGRCGENRGKTVGEKGRGIGGEEK